MSGNWIVVAFVNKFIVFSCFEQIIEILKNSLYEKEKTQMKQKKLKWTNKNSSRETKKTQMKQKKT